METKTCTKCKSEKLFSDFSKLSRVKSGLNPRCKECVNKANKEYYAALPDEKKQALAARGLEWSRKNPEKRAEEGRRYRSKDSAKKKAAETQKRFRRENPDAARSAGERYRQKNLGRFSFKEASRRAAKLQRTPPWANMFAIADIYAEAKRLEELTGIQFHVDHIVPLQGELVSGLHVAENLQLLPAHENLSKSNSFEVAA